MALITSIGGVPLFSTVQEALNWGSLRELDGYHAHTFQNQIGYMGGVTHNQVSVTVMRRQLTPSRPPTKVAIPLTNLRQPAIPQERTVQRQDVQREIVQPAIRREVIQQPATQRRVVQQPTPPTYSGGGGGGGGY